MILISLHIHLHHFGPFLTFFLRLCYIHLKPIIFYLSSEKYFFILSPHCDVATLVIHNAHLTIIYCILLWVFYLSGWALYLQLECKFQFYTNEDYTSLFPLVVNGYSMTMIYDNDTQWLSIVSLVKWPFLWFFKIFFYWSIVHLQCVSFKCIEKWLSYTYIHKYICVYIFFFRFFSIIGHYKMLSMVPCAMQ